jgi:hypothetical protein
MFQTVARGGPSYMVWRLQSRRTAWVDPINLAEDRYMRYPLKLLDMSAY